MISKILYIIGGLILVAILYFIIYPLVSPPMQKSVALIVFNYDKKNDSLYFDKLSQEFATMVEDNNGDLKVDFYFPGGKVKSSKIEITDDYISDENRIKFIHDFLQKSFDNEIKISSETANTQVQAIVQAYNNQSNSKDEEKIYLIGSFPQCYDNELATQGMSSLKAIKEPNPKRTVVWFLKSNNKEPEQKILEELKKKVKLIDQQISVDVRSNTQNKINIIVPVVSKVDKTTALEWIKKTNQHFSPNSNITITSMLGTKEGIKSDKLDHELNDALTLSRENTFLESRTIWQQTLNSLLNSTDSTTPTKVIFIGEVNQPTDGEIIRLGKKEILAPKQLLSNLSKKYKNIEFILCLIGKPKKFPIVEAFKKSLDSAHIKNSVIN